MLSLALNGVCLLLFVTRWNMSRPCSQHLCDFFLCFFFFFLLLEFSFKKDLNERHFLKSSMSGSSKVAFGLVRVLVLRVEGLVVGGQNLLACVGSVGPISLHSAHYENKTVKSVIICCLWSLTFPS